MIRMAKYAMGTRWELVLHGNGVLGEDYLRGAGEAAFEELERLERQLSVYREDSDVSDLNRRAFHEAVPLDPRLFTLLEHARTLHEETEGAFDLTLAPLLQTWGFVGGTGSLPTEAEIEAALAQVGMRWLTLDRNERTVRFLKPGMALDFGAIGKGYALDTIVELLRDLQISSALLHGGTSSVYALGAPPEAPDGWQIALAPPTPDAPSPATYALRDAALSVSAPRHKSFIVDGVRYGHVLDPATGRPAPEHTLAAIVSDTGTVGDALSTALLVRGEGLKSRLEARLDVSSVLLKVDG